MNTYKHKFNSRCPNNNLVIRYKLKIEASFMVQVEHIVTACGLHASAYHEDIAKAVHLRFGGRVTLRAHHHGVDILTVLGEPDQPAAKVVFVSTAPVVE